MEVVPMIVIPDTQGEYELLMRLLDLLDKQNSLDGRVLGLLGDYLDRGSDAKKLIDVCIQLQAEGAQCIRGNHEDVLLKAFSAGRAGDEFIKDFLTRSWLKIEDNTLWSYHIGRNSHGRDYLLEAFKQKLNEVGHLDFLEQLPYYVEHENLILVHSGILPGIPWQTQRTQLDKDLADYMSLPAQTHLSDLAFMTEHDEAGRCVVSGHKVRDTPFISPSRVLLDCGCGFKNRPLVAWVSDTNQVIGVRPDGTNFTTNPD